MNFFQISILLKMGFKIHFVPTNTNFFQNHQIHFCRSILPLAFYLYQSLSLFFRCSSQHFHPPSLFFLFLFRTLIPTLLAYFLKPSNLSMWQSNLHVVLHQAPQNALEALKCQLINQRMTNFFKLRI